MSQHSPSGTITESTTKLGTFWRLLWRFCGVTMVIVLAGLLLTASRLEPAAAGLGTHQQLGLPPCSIRILFGMRCPSCGMTTSWAALTHGQLWVALQSNVGGVMLAIYSLFALVVGVRMAIRARPPSNPTVNAMTLALLTVFAITLLDWGWRLSR